MKNWYSFLHPADEWFVTYAIVPADCASVVMFSIGHTVELYLKAVHAKRTGKVDESIEYGHNIKELWKECKSDQNFMQNYEIRDSLLKAYPLKEGLKKLSERDFESYRDHQELYFLFASYLPDLKYYWAPPKSRPIYSMAYLHPNPYWIEFIRELRHYLEHPSADRLDFVKYKIDQGNLPFHTAQYLQRLYE